VGREKGKENRGANIASNNIANFKTGLKWLYPSEGERKEMGKGKRGEKRKRGKKSIA